MHDSIAASAIPKEEGALDVPCRTRRPSARSVSEGAGPRTVCAAAGRKRRSLQRAGRDNAIVWPPAAAPSARAGPGVGRPGRAPAGLQPLPARTHRAATPPSRGNLARKPDFVTSPPLFTSPPAPSQARLCFPLRRSAGISSALIPAHARVGMRGPRPIRWSR